jgi:hypothetical protein
MIHLKMLGSWVRLLDGREGFVAGSTLDGLTVVVEGKIVVAKDVTAIPGPTPTEHPEPQRSAQPAIKTCHAEADIVVIPPGMSVLQNGQWQ